jgi:hypothetical protein
MAKSRRTTKSTERPSALPCPPLEGTQPDGAGVALAYLWSLQGKLDGLDRLDHAALALQLLVERAVKAAEATDREDDIGHIKWEAFDVLSVIVDSFRLENMAARKSLEELVANLPGLAAAELASNERIAKEK